MQPMWRTSLSVGDFVVVEITEWTIAINLHYQFSFRKDSKIPQKKILLKNTANIVKVSKVP